VPTPESIACRAATLRPFVCSSTGGGLDAAWVHVAGALDITASPQLERALDEASARLVVLDLRDLASIDGAGVHTILEAIAVARRDGRRLILLRGTPNVDRLFALTASDAEVEVADLDLLDPPEQPLRLFADEALVP
jgi:anti-sigma B factor antagonist